MLRGVGGLSSHKVYQQDLMGGVPLVSEEWEVHSSHKVDQRDLMGGVNHSERSGRYTAPTRFTQ